MRETQTCGSSPALSSAGGPAQVCQDVLHVLHGTRRTRAVMILFLMSFIVSVKQFSCDGHLQCSSSPSHLTDHNNNRWCSRHLHLLTSPHLLLLSARRGRMSIKRLVDLLLRTAWPFPWRSDSLHSFSAKTGRFLFAQLIRGRKDQVFMGQELKISSPPLTAVGATHPFCSE